MEQANKKRTGEDRVIRILIIALAIACTVPVEQPDEPDPIDDRRWWF